MKRFLINDLSEIACAMYENIELVGHKDVMFVGFYEDAAQVIKELLRYDDITPYNISLESVDLDEYNKEYYVALDEDLCVWCEPAYCYEDNVYLEDETECLFIADDCCSSILKSIECNENAMYEVCYDLGDEEYDYDCCNCNCENCEFTKDDDNKISNKDLKNDELVNSDKHEEFTTVTTDSNGKVKGFEKSWDTKEGNMNYHTTYKFFSNNDEMMKLMMDNFNIKF